MKYFLKLMLFYLKQVHKKIASGFFGNTNNEKKIYKAQSCSSILREGVHHSNENTLSTSSSSIAKNSAKIDKKTNSDREFIMRNLNSRFISSDGNINEETACEIKKQHSLLGYIDDDICVSKY